MMSSTGIIQDLLATRKLGAKIASAGWAHFPLVDQDAELFSEQTIRFTDENGWDFIKVMSNGYYLAAAYGADIEYSTNAKVQAGIIHGYPIRQAGDVKRLPVLDTDNPVLAREIRVAETLVKHYNKQKPVIATLFTPLTWIQEFSSASNPAYTLELMAHHPKELHQGLEAVLETNLRFLDRLFEAGIDGVFLASQFASSDIVTPGQFREFCLPYDKAIIKYLQQRTWFNLFHVHGDRNLLFDEVIQYEVQALNWENTPQHVPADQITSIAQIRSQTDKLIIGGVDQHHDFKGTEEEIKERLKRRLHTALEENKGGAFIFAPGCGLPIDVDSSKYKLLHDVAVEESITL